MAGAKFAKLGVLTLMRESALRESAPIGPEAETRASARGSKVANGDDRSEVALTLTPPRDSSPNPKGVTYVLNEYTGLTGATPPRKIGKQTS